MSRAADQLQARAEVMRLARLLGRDPEELAYLEALDPADLRALGRRATEALYDAHDGALRRLAAAGRLLPASLTATLAQRAFGPLLSARLAGLLDLDRAVEVAARLPPPFLADVAAEMDPRRASALIASISPELIGQITGELAARGDDVTMGRFVGHLGPAAIAAAVAAMDDAALLRVAFVLEDRDRLSGLLAGLPRGRMTGIVAAAAADGLWVEALDLLPHLRAAQRRQLAAAAGRLDEADQEAILDAVAEHDLWAEIQLIADEDPELQRRLSQRLA